MWKRTKGQQWHLVSNILFHTPLLNSFIFYHRYVCKREQVQFLSPIRIKNQCQSLIWRHTKCKMKWKGLGSAEMLILNRYWIRSQFCDTCLQNNNSNTNLFPWKCDFMIFSFQVYTPEKIVSTNTNDNQCWRWL